MRKKVKGSYTVEASLLMGIILPLLAGIIYMGFFLHDRAFLQGAAYESAACISLQADEENSEGAVMEADVASGRVLGSTNVSVNVSAGGKTAEVFYEGTFRIPYAAAKLLGKQKISIREQVALKVERPSKRIQKIRGVSKVIDAVRRKRT